MLASCAYSLLGWAWRLHPAPCLLGPMCPGVDLHGGVAFDSQLMCASGCRTHDGQEVSMNHACLLQHMEQPYLFAYMRPVAKSVCLHAQPMLLALHSSLGQVFFPPRVGPSHGRLLLAKASCASRCSCQVALGTQADHPYSPHAPQVGAFGTLSQFPESHKLDRGPVTQEGAIGEVQILSP